MTNPLKRGKVWLADLNPTQGSEQAGTRPVIIFQNDLVSQFSTTTIAIPLSPTIERHRNFYELFKRKDANTNIEQRASCRTRQTVVS
jgi:mRNA-degrading endonuclease toxin of MazEF toxin-antitoxin module